MKQRVFIIVDLDESDPQEAIVAVMSSHAEAAKLINQTPSRYLTMKEIDVCGSCKEVQEELEF